MKLCVYEYLHFHQRVEFYGGATFYVKDLLRKAGLRWKNKKWVYETNDPEEHLWVEALIEDVIRHLEKQGFKVQLEKKSGYQDIYGDMHMVSFWKFNVLKESEEEVKEEPSLSP